MIGRLKYEKSQQTTQPCSGQEVIEKISSISISNTPNEKIEQVYSTQLTSNEERSALCNRVENLTSSPAQGNPKHQDFEASSGLPDQTEDPEIESSQDGWLDQESATTQLTTML